ncbi:hypothetical protein [Micromonospora sp. NPDC005367]|uniref:hypothetical protein n=1 Tax=Micromonospora sp. NPDC005367 TaxID=3155590 RepID=UPI0033A9DEFE
MRRGVRPLALALFGVGVGVWVGAGLGPAAAPWAVGACLVAIALSFFGAETDPVADPRNPAAERPPAFRELGPAVERILRLAEEQAGAVVDEARREAERIVAAARSDAVGGSSRDEVAGPGTRFETLTDNQWRTGEGGHS